MVGAFAALLLGAGVGLPAADLAATELPQIFEAACLDGQAKLSPGTAAPVSFDALPHELQQSLGKPASGQVWRLNGPGRAFLYLLTYEPNPNTNPRICGLASDAMNYGAAADAVELRVTGEVHPRDTRSIEWLSLEGGYNALATTTGEFKVLQVNWLSDQQRAAATRALQPIVP
jgi:hypothetical protein